METCPLPLWESLARADDSSTFFQTPAWHHIAARHYKAESVPLLFDFPDDRGGPACLPLLRGKRWGRWRYFSPFGTYTAVVCPRKLEAGEIRYIESALKSLNVHITSSPFTRNPVRVGKVLRSQSQVIDLRKLDPADITREWERDARRRARRASESGVVVRRGEDRDWDTYWELYRGTVGRWGTRARTSHPRALLDDIRASLSTHPGFQFWVAEAHDAKGAKGVNGSIGAGFIGFDHNRHHALWHAAADGAFLGSGAVQLLYREMITAAVARGLDTFDLLGSGGLAGVQAFKSSLGAEARAYDSCLNRAGVVGWLASLRNRLR